VAPHAWSGKASALGLGLILLGSALAAGRASAQQDQSPSLSGCVQHVTSAARQQGAKLYRDPIVDFLLPGDQRSYAFTMPRDGCFGVLAFGHRQVHRLGLTVFAPSGRVLARDSGRDAHAYARFCGQADRPFVVEVKMLDGEGELHLVPLWNAPPTVDALEPAMLACMHAGTPRPSPMDVGPEPEGPPIEIELASVSARLAALGYAPVGDALMGDMPEQSQQARRILLEGGHCYALAGVGEPAVEDIDLRLLAIKDQPILVSTDTTRRRNAVVKVCPTETTMFVLDVRMFRGGGGYAIQAFGLNEAPGKTPAGIDPETRIPFAEMTALLAERGLTPEPLAWGMVRPGATHEVPIRLRGGSCYAIGAIAAAETYGGDLDLSIVDGRGSLRAADVGPNAHPVVYDCPERDETLRAVVRASDLRRPSRFLVVVGRSSLPEAALP
jgi:hypothetical protein